MISHTSLQDSMDGDEKETDVEIEEQQQTDAFYSLYRRHRSGPAGEVRPSSSASRSKERPPALPSTLPLHGRSLQLGDEGDRRNESSETCSKDTVSEEDFSLCLLASNLSVVAESELRAFIAKRLSKGALLSRMGTIATVDLSIAEQAVACYYCLVQPDQPPNPESNRPESKTVVTDYILCFLGSTEKSLELYPSKEQLLMVLQVCPISN
ncbi:protein Njmu-R1-like isoform X1 [Rhincodon typus]|uniref:protein Njmu-R1-like isoform X1 n=1 Tax=Rhincodon typus TaxID=259920 RepID=UPI0020301AA9|nr:protein Njmu-R1-like isoform X1 [Rhincodon typus]